jgi:dsRNA-specific ribonuclease
MNTIANHSSDRVHPSTSPGLANNIEPFVEEINNYYGLRDESFENFLKKMFKHAGVADEYISQYLNDETRPFFNMAFTSSSVDEHNNYELFEQMGDATIGKFIVWSSYEKFPQFRGKPEAVEIVARMKINLGSKDTLAKIAEDIGIWPFISASEDLRNRSAKKLLEDVFEAFIGVIEFVVYDYSDSNRSNPGLAYQIVYKLLCFLFEPYPLKIDYNVLVDAKNRLKGVFDQYKERLGTEAIYNTRRVLKGDQNVFFSQIYDKHKKLLGQATATVKKDAEKRAAEMAITTLQKMGFKKNVPLLYSTL